MNKTLLLITALLTATTLYPQLNNNGGTGHIHAPYQWQHLPDPTTAPNFTSVTGADTTTVKVVSPVDGLQHPHPVVYDTNCASKWYDTADKACM